MGDLGILVVQHDPVASRLIRDELAHGGFRLLGPVDSLARAVARAAHQLVDAVVLDLYLPDVSGCAALALLRDRCPDVTIVVTAPGDFETEARRAIAGGARQYLLREELGRGLLVPVLRHAVGAAGSGGSEDNASARRLLHDLGNTLAVICGESEILLDGLAGPLADDARELHATIEDGIRLFRAFVAARRVGGDNEAAPV
jgi:glutamate dehydrogenase (NAD(P)+)